jgi:uncharacterized protein YcfJ
MTHKFSKIAVAVLVTGAVALPAAGAQAATSGTERALIGALIGGVAGAAVSHGDGGATAIGAVAGAALGAATNDNRRGYRTSYRNDRGYYNQRTTYSQRGYSQRGYNQVRYDRYGRAYYAQPDYRYNYR